MELIIDSIMDKQLDNVSYRTFVDFPEQKFIYYRRIGASIKPKPGKLDDIINWNYGKVKELQMMFTKNVTMGMIPQICAFAHDGEPESFWGMKWHETFGYWNHVKNEIERVFERERVLAYEPDADQIEAGIERINKFGVFATIDVLANGNILLYHEIEAMPYHLVFAKLHLESERAKYMENKSKIIARNAKLNRRH